MWNHRKYSKLDEVQGTGPVEQEMCLKQTFQTERYP